MARKYDFISELYNRTCKTVVANPASWEAFLRSACYNYRLRFDEQLLVHAQRPDATAVLQIDDWNQKFGRWVNRGAHGIAVFEDADQRRQRLVHYFDISDTHPSRFSRRVPIWQMRDEYTAEVIDTLESTFGELNDKETLAVAIESASRNAVEDNIPDYLITTTPQDFKGGGIWGVIVNINGAVQSIGLALLVLFFVAGMVKTCGSFTEVKKPEHALKLFVRFAIAKGAITYGMELMLALFNIVQGTISTIMGSAGFSTPQQTVLPPELITSVEECGFFESIPLWAVTLIGGLFITVMSFILIMTVYGRFFKLYMYTALAPIPLSTFAGEPSQNVGKSFIKSYCAVCLEGAVIVLSCIIFSLFASSPPVVNPDAAAVTQVWSYIGELLFNMLVLVGSVKMSDRIIREMMGL